MAALARASSTHAEGGCLLWRYAWSLSGSPGCCTEGAAPAMAINPSCVDSDVFITVESKAPACVSYLLDFHT